MPTTLNASPARSADRGLEWEKTFISTTIKYFVGIITEPKKKETKLETNQYRMYNSKINCIDGRCHSDGEAAFGPIHDMDFYLSSIRTLFQCERTF